MKKATFIILITFIGLIASCKKDDGLLPAKASGILQKQGNTTYMYGTHKLVDPNGTTIIVLESEELDLDNYINRTVEVKGKKAEELPEHGPDLIVVTEVK